MPEIGQTLSHFKIVEKIGVGGMGEVYLADDTTLDRKVALKFLPEAFTSDPERMARFEREAKLLASLNHPNIAGIYGLEQADGNHFLVLEYVEGETLQARLSQGALPLEDALALCRQIAEGLEAAHEKGVIHRDLKPANVMITAEEKVKILDFGLAKALSDETQSIDSSQSPTLTEAMTRPGVILGTAAYMSPEQAKGKSVDKRADIWAFGCILYECLTGKKAFEGETVTETLAAILRGEPDWSILPGNITPNIRFIINRCLEKARDRRFRDTADIQILLEGIPGIEKTESSKPMKQSRLAWVWAITASLLLLVALVTLFLHFNDRKPAKAMDFYKSVPPMSNSSNVVISPDGNKIAFVASSDESKYYIFICDINSVVPEKLEGTEGASFPFWSPDSNSIGFYSGRKLWTKNISSGPPKEICSAPLTPVGVSNTWNDKGTILFQTLNDGLYRVSDKSGNPVAVTRIDKSNKEIAHLFPSFLPDGNRFLYTVVSGNPSEYDGVYIGFLDSEEHVKILDGTSMALYSESGYILFHREGSLYALPFDEANNKVTGDEISLPVKNLPFDLWGWAAFSVSRNGTLAYRTDPEYGKSQYMRYARSGKPLQAIGEPGRFLGLNDLSRKGHLAVIQNNDIYQVKLDSYNSISIPSDSAPKSGISWSPDGNRIGFSSAREGNWDIYVKKVDSIEKETPIANSDSAEIICDWSSDDKYIIYLTLEPGGIAKIYALPLSENQEPFPIGAMPSSQNSPRLSPNGKWLAFHSNHSRIDQVYVVPFPEGETIEQISKNGGRNPQWKGDGRELYFVNPYGKMMVADIDLGEEIKASNQRELFDPGFAMSSWFAVSPDGKQFFLLKPLANQTPTLITVTLNWTQFLEQ